MLSLEGTQHTPRGATAFAEFFVKTIDWGYATTSSAYMRHYFTSACIGCRAFADGLDRARRAGNRYVGGRITVSSVSVSNQKATKGADISIAVKFDILSFEEVTKAGRYVTADEAHTGEVFVTSMDWQRDAWTVIGLAVDAS